MTTTFDRAAARGSAEFLRDKRLELSALTIPTGRGWAPLGAEVADCLVKRPATIGDVIAMLVTMQEILDELPPSRANNRVSAFNELYLKITRRVDQALVDGVNSPEFLERLDVEFAKRYFDAIGLWNDDDEDTPDVWEVLFKRAGDVEMTRLTAAMLGVNAHINHDLALALIATWVDVGAPEDDIIHPDYLLVNQIFYEEIPPLRRGFSDRWQMKLDKWVGPLDDWSQRMLVTVTRARAWDQARRLWLLRNDQDDFEQARRTMDRAASLLAEWAIIGDRVVSETGEVAEDWRDLLRRILGRDGKAA
ncbi:hypothetical protein Ade02nite_32290 [Paractinoplanes deccanensis]|uniref:Uncharacterized protein n=1 Tax=Paractinoplanes deccanensis TaxID=113561 RepID=A0ABQ3Y3L3_9ACTN|nr:DUF5995 family protein [Actinoplanes deccanensis]GID74588.1 hypothetical protein Ade02nite_32290 [Actinoplanes deccanensis]